MNRKMIGEAIYIRVLAYKRDLAILCKVYSAGQTVLSTAQIRAEGNNTKCVGKKRFSGSVTHGLRKEHVLHSPPILDKVRSYIYANHLP
jgi:hypothetical protein